jgi:ribosomal protein S18 acetylase RimI-like enzyme
MGKTARDFAMAQTLLIRPYEKRDETQVVMLARELQDHEAGIFDRMTPPREIGSWYVTRILRSSRRSGGELLVAERNGQVIGYATVLLGQSSESAMDEVFYTFAYIGDLIVARAARGQGIGKALLAECERLARAAGEKWLRVTVLSRNPRAVSLYRRFGFDGQFIDMEKPLS